MLSKKRETNATKSGTQPKRERVPIHGMDRNILTVIDNRQNKDEFVKRWILDKDDTGSRILRFKMAGYEFVNAESVTVGDLSVYKSSSNGSIVRVPADKEGNFMYLMEIPKEYFDEDKAAKAAKVDDTEVRAHKPQGEQGQYLKTHETKGNLQ